MNINTQTQTRMTRAIKTSESTETLSQSEPSFGDRFVGAVAERPFRALGNLADLGIGTSLAFAAAGGTPASAAGGLGGTFMRSAGLIAGAAHSISALGHFLRAASETEVGTREQAKRQALKGVGDTLAAAGMFAAASGVGPVSLAFLGVGAVTATLAH